MRVHTIPLTRIGAQPERRNPGWPHTGTNETDSTFPSRADVVIIGDGIAGVRTLRALAERSVSVALVEKGRLAGEQSSPNWRFCRTQGRDQAEVPLALAAPRQWA